MNVTGLSGSGEFLPRRGFASEDVMAFHRMIGTIFYNSLDRKKTVTIQRLAFML